MLRIRIKQYMADHGIKQVWLSERTGIPQPKLSAYLTGRSPLYADTFAIICRGLEVSSDDIIAYPIPEDNSAAATA